MQGKQPIDQEEIFSKVVRAGRRTYFFDVRSTKADDFYLTITESKKFTNEDGSFHFKKHKIYLYKEDFKEFIDSLISTTDYVIENRGEEVISDSDNTVPETSSKENTDFTDIDFEDI